MTFSFHGCAKHLKNRCPRCPKSCLKSHYPCGPWKIQVNPKEIGDNDIDSTIVLLYHSISFCRSSYFLQKFIKRKSKTWPDITLSWPVSSPSPACKHPRKDQQFTQFTCCFPTQITVSWVLEKNNRMVRYNGKLWVDFIIFNPSQLDISSMASSFSSLLGSEEFCWKPSIIKTR